MLKISHKLCTCIAALILFALLGCDPGGTQSATESSSTQSLTTTPNLQATSGEKPAGTAEDPYRISDQAGLQELANRLYIAESYDEYASEYYILTADIVLNSSYVSSIGTSDNPFKGVFDGNGHTITSNGTAGTAIADSGFFAAIEGATVKNLTLSNFHVRGNKKYTGALAGEARANSTIDNVVIERGLVTSENNNSIDVGGFFGRSNSTTITNSYATVRVVAMADYSDVGGLVGSSTNSTITNSYATGDVDGGDDGDIGGLVGSSTNSIITNSYATGWVTGENSNFAGGLVGYNVNTTITSSYTTGAVIVGDYSNAGGLVGHNDSNSTITNSYATGAVTGKNGSFIGGLVGHNDSNSTITNSYATGAVTTGRNRSATGGLVGRNDTSSTIINSYATGTVKGGSNSFVGGLAGRNDSNSEITNSYATGAVTGGDDGDVGGLVGRNNNSPITNSYWDTQTTRQTTSAGSDNSAGKITNELQNPIAPQADIYVNWDVNIWDFGTNSQYPVLKNMPESGNEAV